MAANETFQDHAEIDDEYSRRELEADLTDIETFGKPIILKGRRDKLRVTKTATTKSQWRMLHYAWNSFACYNEPKAVPVPRFALTEQGWLPLVPGYEGRMFRHKEGFSNWWAVNQIGTTRYFDGCDGPIFDSLDEWRSWTSESQHTYNCGIPTWDGQAADNAACAADRRLILDAAANDPAALLTGVRAIFNCREAGVDRIVDSIRISNPTYPRYLNQADLARVARHLRAGDM